MIEKDDWRLLNDEVDTTDYSFWFIPEDMSCCVCEECYNDFKEELECE